MKAWHIAKTIRISRRNKTWSVNVFQVPISLVPDPVPPSSPLYSVSFVTSPVFSFSITRSDTGTIIFDSSLGGLTIADQFLQVIFFQDNYSMHHVADLFRSIKISGILPSTNVYGLGEHEQPSFKHDLTQWKTWGESVKIEKWGIYILRIIYEDCWLILRNSKVFPCIGHEKIFGYCSQLTLPLSSRIRCTVRVCLQIN